MDKQKTFAWLKCAGIRAIKTVAQTAIATIRNKCSYGRGKLVGSRKC